MYQRNVPLWASHILSYIVLLSFPYVETYLLRAEPMREMGHLTNRSSVLVPSEDLCVLTKTLGVLG